MTQYAQDTTAHAVILYDKGHFSSTNYYFTRHVRLKVLTNAGTSYANFAVRSPTKSFIEGYTYNIENGEVVVSKLEKSNIYQEEIINGFENYKIFFPNVKPGSVIDLKYTFTGMPSEWQFQDRIPVAYSELILEPTVDLIFKKLNFGFEPIKEVKKNHWITQNMPAIIEEPYMGHYSNYVTHFKFDIETFRVRGVYYELSSSWAKVGENLMKLDHFGGVIRNSGFLREKANELKEKDATLLVKINDAFKYIQENIKWNHRYSLTATAHYSDNFKKNHSGNSAEINLLLAALLKRANINAYPMVLSTRDNGLLNPGVAAWHSLNYVAVYVKDGDQEMVLDATLPYAIPGILPPQCRNLSGWAIDDTNGWWVDLSSGKSNSRKQFITIQSESPGNFSANVASTFEDYDFLEWIETFDAQGSEEKYIASLKTKSTDVDIKGCKLSIDKSKLKAVQQINVDLTDTDYIQDLGSEVIINPFIHSDIINPFKATSRKYPIDFVYPRNRSITVVLKIPEQYTLRKVPESFTLRSDTGGIKFIFQSSTINDVLTIKCDLQIVRQLFTENEYGAMRLFFDEVSRKMSEPIQLGKKT